METQLNTRRVMKVVAIVALFLVSASILVASVLHDLRARETVEMEEFSCSVSDIPCLSRLCPPRCSGDLKSW